jgi:NADPH:quinone reductase-like Zn-dependent oxidoreductase
MTAWQMLVDKAKVQPGETVLVLAAGSGVGVAAVQVAKLFGAEVIATASSAEKLSQGAGSGRRPWHRLPHGRPFGGGQAAHGGPVAFDRRVRAHGRGNVSRGGSSVRAGWAHRPTAAPPPLRAAAQSALRVLAAALHPGLDPRPKGRLFTILDLVASGRLRAVVDRVLP